jgi:hypothetical protein
MSKMGQVTPNFFFNNPGSHCELSVFLFTSSINALSGAKSHCIILKFVDTPEKRHLLYCSHDTRDRRYFGLLLKIVHYACDCLSYDVRFRAMSFHGMRPRARSRNGAADRQMWQTFSARSTSSKWVTSLYMPDD